MCVKKNVNKMLHSMSSFSSMLYKLTKKLSYRKGDRSMRSIYGCPETATFPEILVGICSDRS